MGTITRWVLLVQGILYVVSGAWPVVHLASFEAVTGEKYDDFLVHTVGLLLVTVGIALLAALRRHSLTPEILWVAAGSAGSLLAIEIVYYLNGRLSPIYLLDAAAETVFFLTALTALRKGMRPA